MRLACARALHMASVHVADCLSCHKVPAKACRLHGGKP